MPVLFEVWMGSMSDTFRPIHTSPSDGIGAKPQREIKTSCIVESSVDRRLQAFVKSGRVSRERHVADEAGKKGEGFQGWKEEEFPMHERDT